MLHIYRFAALGQAGLLQHGIPQFGTNTDAPCDPSIVLQLGAQSQQLSLGNIGCNPINAYLTARHTDLQKISFWVKMGGIRLHANQRLGMDAGLFIIPLCCKDITSYSSLFTVSGEILTLHRWPFVCWKSLLGCFISSFKKNLHLLSRNYLQMSYISLWWAGTNSVPPWATWNLMFIAKKNS